MSGDQGHETWIETETVRTPWGTLIVGLLAAVVVMLLPLIVLAVAL